ncbi:hypothetical protein MnTg02_01623 [bacterium MnTg02]|nr:hypothetical protein MnTg02_01623 [bacterium MnTg02]
MGFRTDANQYGASEQGRGDTQFGAFIDNYVERIGEVPALSRNEYLVTLIARSPSSLPAQAIACRAEALQDASINLRVIFSRLSPQQAMKDWFTTFSDYTGGREADYLRLVKNPNLLDAHEQLTLGNSMCWSGDSLRRSWEGHHHISLFEEASPGSARLSQLAFRALWAAAEKLPAKYLDRLTGMQSDVATGDTVTKTAGKSGPHKHHHWISTRH